ncbi:hypothetical protein AVEN_9977-1 [Araneus ventricosus]|uniref:Uncharacterized protein n=1 Tax=Araneus ventricosus TaxID=182803 RepID=A0A4Y2FB58_ARAVE|nr:hypothetical protein AVEN_9977-1 [Araneus ventricosus]
MNDLAAGTINRALAKHYSAYYERLIRQPLIDRRRKRSDILSDGVILLHDVIDHTASKIQEFLQKFKWEVWSHPPAQIRHQSGFQTLIWNKVLFKQ